MCAERRGEFKLAKQTGATAHFARVSVLVAPAESDQVLVTAPATSIRGWGAAAKAGAEDAVRELRRMVVASEALRVEIVAFMGIPTDTTDHDAATATFLAVVAAFPEIPQPFAELSPEQDRWTIAWPT